MKLSIKDANQFCSIDLLSDGLSSLTQKIGTQLGAIEDITDLSPKYQDAIIAKVITCQKHQNADKLSVCLIDYGGIQKDIPRNNENLITVVCGASNVKQGQTVVWLPPGSVVPSTFGKDNFVLSARELRGVVSYGMLASPEELDLNFSNGGILVLPAGNPGDTFGDVYQLNDTIIELENKMFTHRPDCFGIIGVARELSAIMGKKFTSPEWYLKDGDQEKLNNEALPFNIDVKTQFVPRFSAIAMKNIAVADSPIFIKSSLIKAGIKPINSVVDISNYLMLLTAQPIHIYDYDKVAKLSITNEPAVIARNSVKSEQLNLLNGKQVSLIDEQSVVIATDKKAIGLGGIMGGSDTEVDESTKNIIIEVANFDMYNIRKSSMKYGLFTDAVTRNTKKQSPHQTAMVLYKAVDMLKEYCGGSVASNLKDHKSSSITANQCIQIDCDFINERLGSNLDNNMVIELLSRTEFIVENNNDELVVTAPFWRTDITVKEDLVEEVGRLYGFDKLPVSMPVTKISIAETEKLLLFNKKIRENLCAFGANELMTYNFVNGKLLQNAEQPLNQAIKITNALSPNLEYYRLSITPSLLEKVRMNQKLGYEEFALFEIAKVHSKLNLDADNIPLEKTNLALVYAKLKTKEQDGRGAAYYQAKKYLSALAKKLGLVLEYRVYPINNTEEALYGPFQPQRSAEIWANDKKIGIVGEYKDSVSKKFKLPAYCAGFEINVNNALTEIKKINYQIKSKFPAVTQDITISLPETILYSTLESALKSVIPKFLSAELSVSYECIDIYQQSNKVNYTFSLKYINNERTQTIKEVNSLTEKIVQNLEQETGGKQI
jgi:phenylalanyl-tRNA synthetase beta chain